MPKVATWHSTLKTDRKVHHDNSSCTEGNNIEKKNRKEGTGGFPLCNRCEELARQGK